jgi:hypothetical protein
MAASCAMCGKSSPMARNFKIPKQAQHQRARVRRTKLNRIRIWMCKFERLDDGAGEGAGEGAGWICVADVAEAVVPNLQNRSFENPQFRGL